MASRLRLLLAIVALAFTASFATPVIGTQEAQGWSNGQFPQSALVPIHGPGFKASLNLGAGASWNNMRLCALRAGVDIYPGGANSAYRTIGSQGDYSSGRYGTQWYFWGAYKAGRGALAAYPGTSNHGTGRAVDLARPVMRAYIDRNGSRLGWRKVEAFSEWWHVNYVNPVPWPNPGHLAAKPVLRLKSGGPCQGPFVRELEARLGFKRPDSFYSHNTAGAVRRFERRVGFRKPDGIVSAGTWDRLRVTTRGSVDLRLTSPPMAGPDVRSVQGYLNARFKELGYKTRVRADGVYGRGTRNAVMLFQRAIGYKRPTGVVTKYVLSRLRTPIKPPSAPIRPSSRVPTAPTLKITKISRHQGARSMGTASIKAIVLHTTEGWYGSGFLPAAMDYFANNTRDVSTHITVDNAGYSGRSVYDNRRAFHAYKANNYTLGIEQIGTANWTREQWLTRKQQLDTVARWIAFWSYKYKIPIRRCETRNRTTYELTKSGVCTHAQFSRQRSDPGANYPLDVVIKRAQSLLGASG